MKDYQVMPELTAEEYAELKADIAERGVMVPIEFDEDGNILDGYHRYQICQELGITDYPKVIRAGMAEQEKLTHARKLNMARRHLNQEQRRDLMRDQLVETPEKSDRQIADDLGVSPTTVGTVRHEMEREGQLSKLDSSIGADGKTRRKPVSVFNPSNRDAEAIKDSDIQRRLAENEGMNVAGAIREQKRDQLVERLDSVEAREAKAIEGVYDVIVIDPPWPVQKIETDRRPLQIEMDYPVMTLDEIRAIKIPAADDCHVFLWTTEKLLPESFSILDAWGARYVLTFVWHKSNGGYKPIDLPIYNCEFCLYGRIGTPTFTDDHQFKACFETSITGHSEKPDEFYEMLRRVTAGRRLDMFNRRHIEGFDGWGKEAVS